MELYKKCDIKKLIKFVEQVLSVPAYRIWLTSYSVVLVVSLLFVVTWHHRVLYLTELSLLNIVILLIPLILGFALIYRYREVYAHESSRFLLVLALLTTCVMITGFRVIGQNLQVVDEKVVTTTFDRGYFQQLFQVSSVSDDDIARVETASNVETIHDTLLEDKRVLLFFKPECPYCKVSIPVILNRLRSEEVARIRFVDLGTPNGKRLATFLGVEKAATVVSYSHHKGKWQPLVFRLAEGEKEYPKLSETEFNKLVKLIKKNN